MKFIHKDHAFRSGRLRPKQLQLEASLHKNVSGHANIIRYISHAEDNIWLWMCLELADGGDLFDKIEADEGCGVDVAHLYFVQLVNAISWCHGKGVAHRDIKPENMLLSAEGELKVADFGLATQFAVPGRSERKKCGMVCGSPPYIAPEILEIGAKNQRIKKEGGEAREGYEPKISDVWSCAIVLFVLLAGNTPWDVPEMGQYEFWDYVNSEGRPKDELWHKIPPDALSLVRGMLKVDPTERFTLDDVRKHPWFTRRNPVMTSEGRVSNPVNLATQMLESLRIDFDAPVSSSQQPSRRPRPPHDLDSMDIDSHQPSPWAALASTQPETPLAHTDVSPFADWEPTAARPGAVSASQPTYDPSAAILTSPDALLAALEEDPGMSQISQIPPSAMTATQRARRFNDILPSDSLARFYSHWSVATLLPLLLSSLHRLNVPLPTLPAAAVEGRARQVVIRIRAPDQRKQMMHGSIIVEQVELGSGVLRKMEVVEVRFVKAKGDPVGWRRLFKGVAVGCREAIPRRGGHATGGTGGGGGMVM